MACRVVRFEESGFDAQTLASFIRDAFRERLDQGLHFTCSDSTAASIEREAKRKQFYLAVDEESNDLCGTASVYYKEHTKKNGQTYKYACFGNLAVKPGLKRSGVATLLFKHILEQSKDCRHILSDTAVKAESSVKWHLKQGFKISSLASYECTPYYSYCFILPLQKPSKWDFPMIQQLCFLASALKVLVRRRADGSRRFRKR